MNRKERVLRFADMCPRSYVTIDVFDVPVTFDQNTIGCQVATPITVPMYAVKNVAKSELILQECTRDLAIESIIYQVTKQYIKAYDDMCARSVLMTATRSNCTCDIMSTKNKNVYEIVLPDRRLFSGMWYFLCIFELVFLTIKGYSKLKNVKDIDSKMLVYATNCLIQLGMLDIDKEFYKQDHEKIKPHQYTSINKLPLCKLKESPMHMVHWPKPVYRYYRRFRNALKQKYSASPTMIGEHVKHVMAIKPEWCTKIVMAEYANLAASLVKLRYHRNQKVFEVYADVRPTRDNTLDVLGSEMLRVFNLRQRFIIHTSPYQCIYSNIDRSYGHMCLNATMEIFLRMGYNTSRDARYNAVRNLLTLYHELGHLIYAPAMPVKNAQGSSKALQSDNYTRISYETYADKFAVWCVLKNGYTIDDIVKCYADIKHGYSKRMLYRYTRFISHLQKKGVNIVIPADIARMFL